MKINLDAEPESMGAALNAALIVQTQNPDMQTGDKTNTTSGGVRFVVTKNDDSWLVKERQAGQEAVGELPEIGFE